MGCSTLKETVTTLGVEKSPKRIEKSSQLSWHEKAPSPHIYFLIHLNTLPYNDNRDGEFGRMWVENFEVNIKVSSKVLEMSVSTADP